jgi:pimeloyl-ACP methyl ester carboxylesterase
MAHSGAGLHTRVYTARYAHDIVGLVFLDPSTPAQFAAFLPELPKVDERDLADARKEKWKSTFGWTRLNGRCGAVPLGFEAWAGWLKANDCNPSSFTAFERELSAFETSGKEAAQTGPFGALPVLILSADPEVWGEDWSNLPEAVRKRWATAWDSLHQSLNVGLSTRSRRVVARGSHHQIQKDRPELVVEETSRFIRALRASEIIGPWGSTVVR